MSAFEFVASRVALSTLHLSLHTFNGSGNNGTFWTTSQDGVIWTMVNCLDDAMSTPPSETFEPSTSPAVAVYQDTL